MLHNSLMVVLFAAAGLGEANSFTNLALGRLIRYYESTNRPDKAAEYAAVRDGIEARVASGEPFSSFSSD